MKNTGKVLLPIAALTACGASGQNEAPIVTSESVTAVRPEPIEDKLMECTNQISETSYTKSTVVTFGGEFKSYFGSDNLAADFCRWGQAECAFGWQDGKAVLTQFRSDYGRTTTVYDFEAETMEEFVDRIEGEDEYLRMDCDAKPMPSGMQVMNDLD